MNKSISINQNYNNYFYGLRLFSPALALRGVDSISLNLASPAELLITDSQGRKLGKDPINNFEYNEIPGGSYYQEGISNPFAEIPTPTKETKCVWIPDPITGEYKIEVIGTKTGDYRLELLAYDKNGNPIDLIFRGNTKLNNIQEFELNYSKEDIQETEIYRIVNIDIKPGSYPNSINLKSKGVTPVTILSNPFFDAKDIVIDRIIFGGAKPQRGNLEDMDEDDDLDLILHFKTQELQLTSTDTEATLIGQLIDGTLIKGADSVRIISKGKSASQKNYLLVVIPLYFLTIGLFPYKRRLKFSRKHSGSNGKITVVFLIPLLSLLILLSVMS